MNPLKKCKKKLHSEKVIGWKLLHTVIQGQNSNLYSFFHNFSKGCKISIRFCLFIPILNFCKINLLVIFALFVNFKFKWPQNGSKKLKCFFKNGSNNWILHTVTPGRTKLLKLLYPNVYTQVISRNYTRKYEAFTLFSSL